MHEKNILQKYPAVVVATLFALTGCIGNARSTESARPTHSAVATESLSHLTGLKTSHDGVCADPIVAGLGENACLLLPDLKKGASFRVISTEGSTRDDPDALIASINEKGESDTHKLSPIWQTIILNTVQTNPVLKQANKNTASVFTRLITLPRFIQSLPLITTSPLGGRLLGALSRSTFLPAASKIIITKQWVDSRRR